MRNKIFFSDVIMRKDKDFWLLGWEREEIGKKRPFVRCWRRVLNLPTSTLFSLYVYTVDWILDGVVVAS
jgi:hypothetical protein